MSLTISFNNINFFFANYKLAISKNVRSFSLPFSSSVLKLLDLFNICDNDKLFIYLLNSSQLYNIAIILIIKYKTIIYYIQQNINQNYSIILLTFILITLFTTLTFFFHLPF